MLHIYMGETMLLIAHLPKLDQKLGALRGIFFADFFHLRFDEFIGFLGMEAKAVGENIAPLPPE